MREVWELCEQVLTIVEDKVSIPGERHKVSMEIYKAFGTFQIAHPETIALAWEQATEEHVDGEGFTVHDVADDIVCIVLDSDFDHEPELGGEG